MRVCRKPCGSVAMPHSRRARLGSSHAVSSFLLLSRLLLLFQASINNNRAVEVFLKSGAELRPILQAELWGPGEQVAQHIKRETCPQPPPSRAGVPRVPGCTVMHICRREVVISLFQAVRNVLEEQHVSGHGAERVSHGS